MDDQLEKIRRAYDLTVDQFRKGIDPMESVPGDIRDTHFFQSMDSIPNINSAATDIREYLSPEKGMKFLDAGCSANLANYNLGEWPSTYYGVDISPVLIEAMKDYAEGNNIPVGGLYVSDISSLPFENRFFDIAAVIGVLEYCTFEYISQALQELHRVLETGAKAVIDIPNSDHPHAADMQRLETYLERPNFIHPRPDFEHLLKSLYKIENTDDSQVMIKYFVRSV
ncbi:MAG: class I SAM-dependent methyltransferase [Dehalococcoidales bacterium]|nr:class I SAM-dependent methyltransferase [Dehalococcoidales bacterium]